MFLIDITVKVNYSIAYKSNNYKLGMNILGLFKELKDLKLLNRTFRPTYSLVRLGLLTLASKPITKLMRTFFHMFTWMLMEVLVCVEK